MALAEICIDTEELLYQMAEKRRNSPAGGTGHSTTLLRRLVDILSAQSEREFLVAAAGAASRSKAACTAWGTYRFPWL